VPKDIIFGVCQDEKENVNLPIPVVAPAPEENEAPRCQFNHFRWDNYSVPEVHREDKEGQKSVNTTIHGTQRIHCVRNTGVAGFVEICRNTCLCSYCQGGGGHECESKEHIKPFACVNIFGNNQKHGKEFENQKFGGNVVVDLKDRSSWKENATQKERKLRKTLKQKARETRKQMFGETDESSEDEESDNLNQIEIVKGLVQMESESESDSEIDEDTDNGDDSDIVSEVETEENTDNEDVLPLPQDEDTAESKHEGSSFQLEQAGISGCQSSNIDRAFSASVGDVEPSSRTLRPCRRT